MENNPEHVHLGYFGSEIDCKICNPNCGEKQHQYGLDRGTRMPTGQIVLTQTIMPCGTPNCPVLKMWKPMRIHRLRLKGWKMPPNTLYVGRPTKWGNPWKVGAWNSVSMRGNMTLQDVLDNYWEWVEHGNFSRSTQGGLVKDSLHELRGKNLADWCPLDQPCHVPILLEAANQ